MYFNIQYVYSTQTETYTQILQPEPYIYVSRAPRTLFLASTVAPASSSARTVSLCPFMADCQRAVRSCCRIGGVRGESCRGGQGAHAYMHTHGCVPGCVLCVNQYMHLHAHIPRYAHTVYIHTHVYIHTVK